MSRSEGRRPAPSPPFPPQRPGPRRQRQEDPPVPGRADHTSPSSNLPASPEMGAMAALGRRALDCPVSPVCLPRFPSQALAGCREDGRGHRCAVVAPGEGGALAGWLRSRCAKAPGSPGPRRVGPGRVGSGGAAAGKGSSTRVRAPRLPAPPRGGGRRRRGRPQAPPPPGRTGATWRGKAPYPPALPPANI